VDAGNLEPSCHLACLPVGAVMAYQATTVPAMGSSPWNRRPHFSITRRDAALVAMVALMIRSSPTASNPWRTPVWPPSVASP
jgi:hypothetical protein